MKRYATIQNGIVTNISAAGDDWLPPENFVEAPLPVDRGWLYADNTFSPPPPPPPPPPPEEISDRQFFHALALTDQITQAEALAAVKTGTLPAAFEAFISTLPADDQFSARMLLEGATTFRRSHPLTMAFGAMSGMTDTQIDDLWRLAASL